MRFFGDLRGFVISDDVKLAVDLIVLLEENQIPARTVLRALDIVKRDYEKKLTRDDEAEK
ncbi:DUF2496 domain-containing protein [Escherichia coli]|nr:DUF2496 domain-containing protein [Escherichia coli]